ncbi:MAG: hypothetical protein JEZ02_18210 [Desulfatibacillum sp.]|nr:hypothetical protein [Desulfatibacillum sp.]
MKLITKGLNGLPAGHTMNLFKIHNKIKEKWLKGNYSRTDLCRQEGIHVESAPFWRIGISSRSAKAGRANMVNTVLTIFFGFRSARRFHGEILAGAQVLLKDGLAVKNES